MDIHVKTFLRLAQKYFYSFMEYSNYCKINNITYISNIFYYQTYIYKITTKKLFPQIILDDLILH